MKPQLIGRKTYTLDGLVRCFCGDIHRPEEHQAFLESMPQKPEDLVEDLIRMGHYSSDSIELAKTLTYADFRKALVLQLLNRATPEQRKVCNELIQQAGGLGEAFSAAFGPRAGEFFGDVTRSSKFRRRDFLTKVVAAAAIVTAASCAQTRTSTEQLGLTEGSDSALEKTELSIGYIPIACSIPIVLAEPKGIYEKYGLKVNLRKMPNWAAVRESAVAGELDAYHMLSPMPIAITLGLGSTMFPIQLASIENINGQSITVAMEHKDKVNGPSDFKGMTIGIPFAYSMHNLLLRYYLASGGVDPDNDVKLEIVPPPDSVAKMAVGEIDAFLMPDNFGQRAVAEQVGFIHLLTKDLWSGHPCCAFAASQEWIDANPNTFRAVNKAIIDSAGYADLAENRSEVAALMAPREYLNQPEATLNAVLTGKFENGLGEQFDVPDRIGFDPYPWKSFSKWISSQLVRWDLMPEEKANYEDIANQIFMTDLARELSMELGQSPPNEATRVERLKFDEFDPSNPTEYLNKQANKFNS
jgi:nitrate/nitrite transport system substrate-binding protein